MFTATEYYNLIIRVFFHLLLKFDTCYSAICFWLFQINNSQFLPREQFGEEYMPTIILHSCNYGARLQRQRANKQFL